MQHHSDSIDAKTIRRQALEEAAAEIERVAHLYGNGECCGCGYQGSSGSPPECCGDPLYMISDRTSASAIRALINKPGADAATAPPEGDSDHISAAKWRRDCALLLAQLDAITELTGEEPEDEDVAIPGAAR